MGLLDNLTPKVPQREPLPNTNVQTAPAQVEDLKLSKALKEAAGQILAQMLLERASQQEQMVINSQGVMVDRRGYKYLYVFTTEPVTLNVTVMGQDLEYNLTALMWNPLPFPDGTRLTCENSALVVMFWSNYALPLATAENVTVTNWPQIQPVSLTGRSVQEVTIINALAIADTNPHSSGNINVQSYSGKKSLFIVSSLNQSCTLSFNVRTLNLNGFTAATFNIQAGKYAFITAQTTAATGSFAALDEPFSMIEVVLQCATAPTSGSISVYMEGVQG
ncbi:hypothetical protein [Alicyclobacillus shizuokensis]|uniref:hypothetical protein n=1 Tax=Alicyclobacillus shizuokensis TaxID=392014 RepID=UPI0008308ADD|nr:hypothetical protein [Alicyclobacillus shizuokensis]